MAPKRPETEEERHQREAKEAEQRRQARVGVNAPTFNPSKKKKDKISEDEELAKRRRAIQDILDTYLPKQGLSADSILGKIQHLNDLNEIGIAIKGLLETIESFLKLIFQTEYLTVQRNLYNKAPESLRYKDSTPIYVIDGNGKKTTQRIEGPSYGKPRSNITRRDVILNGYIPPPNFMDALQDELNMYTNKISGVGIKHSYNYLQGYIAERTKQSAQENRDLPDLAAMNMAKPTNRT